jgi:BirA family transcriptional regulator, biotin operon repressor / biotin---[acetyl-CoA-carboxylase] ligase
VGPGGQIVDWLRGTAGPLSGAELARRLGCSRAAVWKQVAALRRAGYDIRGTPSAGYVLAAVPDRLGPSELAPYLRGSWRRVEWRAEIDSTQHLARELARAGAEEGTVVIAESQTGGRGRLGRRWHSPPGVNLYCSLVLRPSVPLATVPSVALVAGLAVVDAVCEVTALRPALKWPNDVLVAGRKVAGILTELEAEVERVHHVIAGIGVNLNGGRDAFPPELATKATSLRLASGREVHRAAFTAGLLAALEARYRRFLADGFAAMRSEWEAHSALTGKEVRVTAPEGEVTGRVLGIDDDGALRLAGPRGELRVVGSEVTVPDGYDRLR